MLSNGVAGGGRELGQQGQRELLYVTELCSIAESKIGSIQCGHVMTWVILYNVFHLVWGDMY